MHAVTMRALRYIHQVIYQGTANTIVCMSVDYCNSIPWVSEYNIIRLRASRTHWLVLCPPRHDAPYRSPETYLWQSLHWLPIWQCITFNIATLTFKVRLHRQPVFLADLIVDYTPSRSRHYQGKDLLVVPKRKTRTLTAFQGHSMLPLWAYGTTWRFIFGRRPPWSASVVK